MQSQSQLKAIYKDAAEIISDNCDCTLFLSGRGKNAKEISDVLGKETIDSYNQSENRGAQTSHGLNYQKLGKELMSQDEIATMDGGKCILQVRGVRPFFSEKYDIINELCEHGYEMQHGHVDELVKSRIDREIAEAKAAQQPTLDPTAEPVVTILFTESPHLEIGQQMPLHEADALFARLDAEHRGGGYYDKTDFRIDFTFQGEPHSYSGRQDFGDRDGSLIEHIREYQTFYLNDEKWKDHLTRQGGPEAWAEDHASREAFLTEIIPYMELHCNLSRLEQEAQTRLASSDTLTPEETAYYGALVDYASEDQLNSYKSQVQHYTDLIKSKSEWDLAGIYADEAITGTQVTKREDFQRLINDCMNGDVDMIITKSISRFARNTLDTLKYVRMLKEKGIAVFFEEENINTLTMDGELLLVILSSVAQQEVENISANVKKGLKMKMQRGELVGFQGCLGYDYHPEDKSISINEEDAEIVRYIFRRYIEGAGGSVIAQELENLGYKTKRGSTRWAETTVIGIIKNEKYKGDILMGKTFTLDPISKRRLDNFGEEDQFYIRDHHEAIISEEMFEKAQEILKRRAKPRRLGTDGKREKFSRKYAFSCMLECGFCGGTLTRRSWHSGSQYNKVIWQCVTATKKGKKFCPDSKGIAEETIEQAFIESYRLLCQNNKDVLDEFIARTEETLSDSNASKQLAKVEKDIAALDAKRAKLVDMRLEEIIDKDTYEQKYFDLSSQIEQLQKQRESLQESAETESTMKKRIAEFRRTLEENEVLDTFDRYVFESIVEKVIVGGYDEDGNKDPAMLTFIYKTGFKNSLDGTNFKPPRKNSKAAKKSAGLCSHATDEAKSMCSYRSDDTRGNGGQFGQKNFRRCFPIAYVPGVNGSGLDLRFKSQTLKWRVLAYASTRHFSWVIFRNIFCPKYSRRPMSCLADPAYAPAPKVPAPWRSTPGKRQRWTGPRLRPAPNPP